MRRGSNGSGNRRRQGVGVNRTIVLKLSTNARIGRSFARNGNLKE